VYVLPGAAARLLARSVPALLAWSVALALAEGVTGLYVAYWLDLPPGPPVAVLGASVYAALALATSLGARALGSRPEAPS
jgi:ABC-type Mn2+/Zn2+ transport system permease subunit